MGDRFAVPSPSDLPPLPPPFNLLQIPSTLITFHWLKVSRKQIISLLLLVVHMQKYEIFNLLYRDHADEAGDHHSMVTLIQTGGPEILRLKNLGARLCLCVTDLGTIWWHSMQCCPSLSDFSHAITDHTCLASSLCLYYLPSGYALLCENIKSRCFIE